MKDSFDWDIYSKIVASTYRSQIFLLLSKKSLSPKQISKRIDIAISHVSRTLSELEDLGLITCLTSEEIKKGKIYTATEESKPYFNEIKKNLN
ncbi:MAG: helix-turn-helix domain-containing protein [Candidatus Lokiarchaeota archaeon]|nr:helix-turn-helix domain-containing protein [Candidatus Lokiarchaeota archaeon]MBD3340814.1 helix-turn-helix domain-containing protein [Candidatus Lokiarchaeota archaeon]